MGSGMTSLFTGMLGSKRVPIFSASDTDEAQVVLGSKPEIEAVFVVVDSNSDHRLGAAAAALRKNKRTFVFTNEPPEEQHHLSGSVRLKNLDRGTILDLIEERPRPRPCP